MELEKQEKIKQAFGRVAIWDLEGEHKQEVAQTIIEDVETGVEYRSQMVLSSIIASLGLLINATPVVIGAMLIAPILRPIQAVAFAISTGNRRLFWKGLILLISSILVGIVSAILITWLIPLSELTNEILIRTQPTLIDLGIAFASGCVAFLAFGFKKIAAGLAGVAMAASLVPPLAVVGIGIGMMNFQVGMGSWILFLTNLVAIILSGAIIFYMFGYFPNQKKELKTSIITGVFSLGIMALLCIPLATSLFNIIDDINDKKTISSTAQTYLQNIDERISIESITYKGDSLSLGVRSPAEVILTIEDRTALTQEIATALDSSIDVDLEITPFVTADASRIIIQTPQEKINEHIDTFLSILYPPVVRVDSQLITNNSLLLVDFYTVEQFNTERFQQQLEAYFKEKDISIDNILINRNFGANDSETMSQQEKQRQLLEDSLVSSFSNTFTGSYLHTLKLLRGNENNQGIVYIVVTSSEEKELFEEKLGERKLKANALTKMNITIESIVQYGVGVVVE